ncbi:hypothetical protein QBC35DRAFT_451134 [Podospora australis]|uniref:Uncharacterized protein n=1 Tax=Podospora australis TaxID=1536484 RepID=A0AAN7AJT0_9PEZI|nr:hypothetical protein QBC35DRAFT_451134 [Podospora australis]
MAYTNGVHKPASGINGINGMNGINGVNGINGTTNKNRAALGGHHIVQGAVKKVKASSFLSRATSLSARLSIWYLIYTILFRCPANLEACDQNSPAICKPYFQARHAVVPHLEPYYDQYAAPYVEAARPYYNTVDEKVISPVWGYAREHGAPRVEQAQAFGKAQWEKNVQPQLTKYQNLAWSQYNEKLAPHLQHVSTTVRPYYDIAYTNALQTYHEILVPSYQVVQPYARQGYSMTSTFAKGTLVPSFVWAWDKTYTFLDGTVWPHVRAVYLENVEPQLVKIGKRLGRYSGSKKSVPKPVSDVFSSGVSAKTTSSFTKPAPSASASSASISTTASSSVQSKTIPSAKPPQAQAQNASPEHPISKSLVDPITPPEVDEGVESEDPVRRNARETVAADLKDWQERYAKAADEGAAAIDERVQEIAKKMIRRNARVKGRSLLDDLNKTVVSELVNLRSDIIQIVAAANKEGAQTEDTPEKVSQSVRRVGMAIKEKAKAVRSWREEYEAELQSSVTNAAQTHFAILQDIRDLALQKIGMKWAWTDGITYKDWAKYHLLKSRFDEWKGDLEQLIVTHPNLEAAHIEGANIEDEAMKLAATAAKELTRLKQVAGWKLAAGDDTDEFDSTLMQQAAETVEAARLAAGNMISNAGESVEQAQEAIVDKVSKGASAASEVVDHATDVVAEQASQVANSARAVIAGAEDAAASAAADVTSAAKKVVGSVPSSEAGESAASVASEEIASVVEPTNEANPDTGDDNVSPTQSPAVDLEPEFASAEIIETPPVVHGNATEDEEDVKANPAPIELAVEQKQMIAEDDELIPEEEVMESRRTPEAAASVKPALFGAAAQVVPGRVPVLEDDEDDEAGALHAVQEEIMAAYKDAMSRADTQYSKGLSFISAQLSGTPLPAHQKLLASVTSAYSNAMASASSRLDVAMKAASEKIQATPTRSKKNFIPTALPVPSFDWSRIESLAAERLQQGREYAESQYQNAKIAVGLATPTPSTPAEHIKRALENAKHNYYANYGVAQARYSEFLSAASSASSQLASFASASAAAAATGAASAASAAASGASSAASVAGEHIGSVADAALSGASSAASVAGETISSVAGAAASGASSAASVAGENASFVAGAGYDQASSAIDYATDGWEVVISKISIQVYGAPTPTPWYESVYSGIGEYAASATSVIGEYACSATSAAGEAAAVVTGAAVLGGDETAKHYDAVSALVSELLIGKEPTFSESVVSRLNAAYAPLTSVVSSAASAASEAVGDAVGDAGEKVKSVGEKVASAASEATEAVKEKVQGHDEL